MVRSGQITILGIVGIVVVFLLTYLATTAGSGKVQPLAYNHKIHIENVGLECVDCHSGVETSQRATIPNVELCQNCHSGEPLTESPTEDVLIKEYVETAREIPWEDIYRVPDHVFFSHRRHVAGGEIACIECHGDVGQMTQPVSAPAIDVTMEYCMDCHQEHKVMNDCLSCHR